MKGGEGEREKESPPGARCTIKCKLDNDTLGLGAVVHNGTRRRCTLKTTNKTYRKLGINYGIGLVFRFSDTQIARFTD